MNSQTVRKYGLRVATNVRHECSIQLAEPHTVSILTFWDVLHDELQIMVDGEIVFSKTIWSMFRPSGQHQITIGDQPIMVNWRWSMWWGDPLEISLTSEGNILTEYHPPEDKAEPIGPINMRSIINFIKDMLQELGYGLYAFGVLCVFIFSLLSIVRLLFLPLEDVPLEDLNAIVTYIGVGVLLFLTGVICQGLSWAIRFATKIASLQAPAAAE
ncbi:hypothetical protein JYT61_00855 [bacterium AH-315-E10]|nr:hypothetical protein [bacterium AH-315-E10]